MNGPSLYGNDLWGNPIQPASRGKLAEKFVVPPFSVLNTREGFWQERKRAWLALGMRPELGRKGDLMKTGENLAYGGNGFGGNRGGGRKQGLTFGAFSAEFGHRGGEQAVNADGTPFSTSLFDPVLAEICYRWFCPTGGQVLDPFAGGSVRGVCASFLGRKYFGVELRPEQCEENRTQAAEICSEPMPIWKLGDSTAHYDAPPADFVFSCPPYGDLEVYSDDPRDISTLPWEDFALKLCLAVQRACAVLKNDRFAAFVAGDFRCQKGNYRAFPALCVEAFRAAGLAFYNEAILVNSAGSLPIRVGKQFNVARKLGKCHQNVLIFVKGCPRRAAAACEAVPEE